MKKKYRIPGVALFALLACLSCSDDGDGNGNAGDISFYGETYSLSQGAIYHDNNHTVIAVEDYVFEDRYEWEGEEHVDQVEGFTAEVKNEQTGNFLVGLYEDGFKLSDLTQDARGSGACICLRFASQDTGRLVPGTYTYSPNHDANTFLGYSSVNYDTGETPAPNRITEGTVEVAQTGEIYTITFDCKTSFGGNIKGNYRGTLKPFDIRKDMETVNLLEDIKLEALFDRVDYTDLEGVSHSEPDYLRANAFLRTSTQQLYSANLYKDLAISVKEEIDIALAYDREREVVRFASPIEMRSLLWHNTFENESLFNYTFDLPCHTKYMPAPADFTDADFEALQRQEDFVFDFAEAEVSLPVNVSLPCFVFVQTGNGIQGVIRVKEIHPAGTEMISGITYPLNPYIVMDMKYPHTYSEQQLR